MTDPVGLQGMPVSPVDLRGRVLVHEMAVARRPVLHVVRVAVSVQGAGVGAEADGDLGGAGHEAGL